MTVANARRADDPPSENEKELIEELRLRLKDKLPGGIPEDLDTDLNLNRWIRGYNGNIDDRIVQNFSEYVASRKAADFIGKDFVDKFFEMENIAPFLPFIASSRLQDRQFSEELNAFLFVERAWSQPKEFIKVFKTSDYLLHCFGYSEVLLQLILNREKKQDPSKGPVQFIVLFDLQTVNIMDYVTPSGYLKLWQLRSALWQDWFPEMCSAIYLLHPPRIISLVWSIAKLFLSEENLKRIVICHSEKELLKHLPKWFVPKEYGGDFVNQIPPGDESGVSIRRKITSADYYKPHLHYKKYGIERPKPSKKDIGPGEKFIIPLHAGNDKNLLLWDLTVSGEVEFCIYKEKNESELLYPKLRLVTNKLNEEGELLLTEDDSICLEFQNKSSYFTVKLEYSLTMARNPEC